MDIQQLRFGIYSPEEILRLSVCEIKYDKPKKPTDLDNTLYDPRLGPIEDDKPCPTCKQVMLHCPGHFGHIVLNAHIMYPLLHGIKTVLNFLKCHCYRCSRLIFSSEKLSLFKLDTYRGIKRYEAIVDATSRVEICWNCGSQLARFYIQDHHTKPKIFMFYKTLSEKKSKENSVEVSIDEIERVFQSIIDDDIILFGFNPHRFRPKNLILSVIPVLPPCARPYVITNGDKCEDDLTSFYKDILKHNAKILSSTTDEDKLLEIASLSFYISSMYDNTKGRCKQPNGRPKKCIKGRLAGKAGFFRGNLHGKRTDFSSRTVVGGNPLLNMNQVEVPDCIAMNVTVPKVVCKSNFEELSEIVNSGRAEIVFRTDEKGNRQRINLHVATRIKGTPIFYGDKVFRKVNHLSFKKVNDKDTVVFDDVKYVPVKINEISDLHEGDRIIRRTGEVVESAEVAKSRFFKLHIGDEVRRHLQDGDQIAINRQPTLHMGSFLGVKVQRQRVPKLKKGERPSSQQPRRSIGTALSMTTPLNMDYDGDELNEHIPQTIESIAEYAELIDAAKNIVNGQCKPMMGIVQNCCLGCFLMTQGWVRIPKDEFCNICIQANLDLSKMEHISRMYVELIGKEIVLGKNNLIVKKEEVLRKGEVLLKGEELLYTGRGLLSMCLPITFNYTSTNKALESEPILKIRAGTIYEGAFDKSTVGPVSGAIHHFLSPKDGENFLNWVQHSVNPWVAQQGISLGIQDCIADNLDEEGFIPEVRKVIEMAFLNATIAESTQSNPLIAESKINTALNDARNAGQKIAKETLPKTNRFLPFIQSKTKGSMGNVCQIIVLLGQQNIGGQRLERTCIDGNRGFPHYSKEKEDEMERWYEQDGFIRHGFFNGLNPHEFWNHACSGREGIVATACTTAKTGYLQRRIRTKLEDLKVEYDYTIRNSTGLIVQFIYGGDGITPSKLYKIDGGYQCHLATQIEELNTQYEIDCFKNGTRAEIFRETKNLGISTIVESTEEYIESPATAESQGSNTPKSAGTVGSFDNDYDE